MDTELTPIIESGTRVDVYVDALDGIQRLSGKITHLYDGSQDAVILTRRGAQRVTVIPAARVLYVEQDNSR